MVSLFHILMAVSAETLLFGFDIVVFCCTAYVPKFHRNIPIRKQHVLRRLNVANIHSRHRITSQKTDAFKNFNTCSPIHTDDSHPNFQSATGSSLNKIQTNPSLKDPRLLGHNLSLGYLTTLFQLNMSVYQRRIAWKQMLSPMRLFRPDTKPLRLTKMELLNRIAGKRC